MKEIIEIIKKKWLRETALTVLLIAVIIIAYVALNLWVKSLDLTDIDFTSEKLYSLSDESKKQVSNIDKNITIYLFGFEDGSNVVDLAKQYSKENEKITVEMVDITERTDLASKYEIQDGDQKIVIESESKSKTIDSSELYTIDYTTYEYSDLTEQKLTNGILTVTMVNVPTIYFLTGHNEYDIDTHMITFSERLENEVYEIQKLNLLVRNEIPKDCTVLVIASPENDFTDYETELITNYINNGGNILWLNDSYSHEGTLANVQKILDLYGVEVSNEGVVFETDTSKMLVQTPYMILPDIEYTSVTGDLSSSGMVLLIDTGIITYKNDEELEALGVSAQTILKSSEKSFLRTDLKQTSYSATSEDKVGSNILGALMQKKIDDEKTSELIIYSNNLFIADYPLTIQYQQISAATLYNNIDLGLNSVAYLADREDAITIRKAITAVPYTATKQQDTIVKIIIFGVPVIIILAGIVVWQIRRRKK